MDLNDLTAQLNSAVKVSRLGRTIIQDEERTNLIAACDQLKAVLESPVDFASRLVFATHQSTAVRVAIEMGIFNVMATAKETSISLEVLASNTGADRPLIIRIMRILTAMDICLEVERDFYSFAPIAKAFVDGSPIADALKHFHDVHGSVLVKLPEYLVKTNFKNPSQATAGPFQYAFATKLHHFDWLKHNQPQFEAFNSVMTAQRREKGDDWFTYFPVEERLNYCQATQEGDSLLVDVGGGLGTDLKAFWKQFPHIGGRLILQDTPDILANFQDDGSNVEAMVHDFFTPQPIKGARAYYLRTVLHDWPDKEAKAILENIVPAMAHNSKLLINEYVLPGTGVPLFPSLLDLSMMAIFSSWERTRQQWEDLLSSAGLVVVKIWSPPTMNATHSSLLEARLCP